jgi:hypothetical protein
MLKRCLAGHGISSAESVQALDSKEFWKLFTDSPSLRKHSISLCRLRVLGQVQGDYDNAFFSLQASVYTVLKEADAASKANGILSQLGLPADLGKTERSADGAPPGAVHTILKEAADAGLNVCAVADSAVTGRMLQAVQASSAATYASHWQGIRRFGVVFQFDPCNPTVHDVRRVAVCVNTASTQRGWMAAWKLALLVLGRPWPAEHDLVLKAIQAGTFKARAAGPPRRRLRGSLLLKMLQIAVQADDWPWAATAVFNYFFLLRMPSEFFRQFGSSLFREMPKRGSTTGWTYGPIMRKGRGQCSITRKCCCRTAPQLCLHSWASLIHQHCPAAAELGAAWWTSRLHIYLNALGMETSGWATHCCRRGAAADMLASEGLRVMLQTGGWSSSRSAFPYTPAEEIKMTMMANLRIDESDEE